MTFHSKTRPFAWQKTGSVVALVCAMLLMCASGCTLFNFGEEPDKVMVRVEKLRPTEQIRDLVAPDQLQQFNNIKITRLPPIDQQEAHDSRDLIIPVAYDLASGESDRYATTLEIVRPEPSEESNDSEGQPGPANSFPIDLANALALGGANNLQIQMAREKVYAALAVRAEAEAKLLPSLRFGIGYNKHDGRLQATEGEVLEAGRNSLFVGGGAGLGNSSLAGGASGPSRLVMNFSLVDAAFDPLVGRQLHEAESAAESAATNDSLTKIALAYFDLVEANTLRIGTQNAFEAAAAMAKLAEMFAKEGKGSEAEKYRAVAAAALWEQKVRNAERKVATRGAELARLLRLEGSPTLIPLEQMPVAISMIDADQPVEQLVATGLVSRPELAQHQSIVEATISRMRQESWRPWLPSIQVGASAGTFGGGPSSAFEGQSDRSDVDLLAVWEIQNLGFGNMVKRRQRAGEVRQAEIEAQMIHDQIVKEIVTAAADAKSYKQQMKIAEKAITAANKSFEANRARIREAEGLPIELLQAIRARAEAESAYVESVSQFNRSQYRLLRAVGSPLVADPSE